MLSGRLSQCCIDPPSRLKLRVCQSMPRYLLVAGNNMTHINILHAEAILLSKTRLQHVSMPVDAPRCCAVRIHNWAVVTMPEVAAVGMLHDTPN